MVDQHSSFQTQRLQHLIGTGNCRRERKKQAANSLRNSMAQIPFCWRRHIRNGSIEEAETDLSRTAGCSNVRYANGMHVASILLATGTRTLSRYRVRRMMTSMA